MSLTKVAPVFQLTGPHLRIVSQGKKLHGFPIRQLEKRRPTVQFISPLQLATTLAFLDDTPISIFSAKTFFHTNFNQRLFYCKMLM